MYDAASDNLKLRAGVPRVDRRTDQRSPRFASLAAIEAVAAAGDLEATLDGVLAAAAAALGAARWARSSSRIPTARASSSSRRTGWTADATAALATAVNDPADPVHARPPRRARRDVRSRGHGGGRLGLRRRLPAARRGQRRRRGPSLGAIGFGWPAPRALDATERETLTALAGLAALAIDRTRLASTAAERSEWFERMAHTDPLTGLANERTVGRVLELELARAGRQGSEVSFAMFDVDDFRATNQEGGHEAGDDVLRRVAAVLAESVRLVDTVGRIGGDEFVLVAPGSAGAMVARRVLDGIAALPRGRRAGRSRSRPAWPASRSTGRMRLP